jgi:hypothetical protein
LFVKELAMKLTLELLLTLAVMLSFGLLTPGQDAFAQNPAVMLTPSTLTFGVQIVGVSSASQVVTLTNTGSSTLNISYVVLTGTFYGDFAVVNNCGLSVPAGQSCSLNVAFTPLGTGIRSGSMLVFDDASGSPQSVTLSGTGAGSCANISDCAYQEVNARTSANQKSFFVYQDADSGFNHGFPSGFFGNIDLQTIIVNAACIDDPTLPSGCTNDMTRLDGSRGTVFSLTFPQMSEEQFGGVNFQDPENYNVDGVVGNGYDLIPATMIQFDVRSPNSVTAQFGVGGCVASLIPIGPTWTTMTIPIDSLFPPPSRVLCVHPTSRTHTFSSVFLPTELCPQAGVRSCLTTYSSLQRRRAKPQVQRH